MPTIPIQHGEYLNTQEANARLRRAKGFLEKKRVFGGGPAYLKIGRSVVYRTSELDAWAAKHSATSTSQY